jgi:hypothetical protein
MARRQNRDGVSALDQGFRHALHVNRYARPVRQVILQRCQDTQRSVVFGGEINHEKIQLLSLHIETPGSTCGR